jgi:hypothetical protein
LSTRNIKTRAAKARKNDFTKYRPGFRRCCAIFHHIPANRRVSRELCAKRRIRSARPVKNSAFTTYKAAPLAARLAPKRKQDLDKLESYL